MARRPRIDAPGIPQHVLQRGVNRCACFFDDVDRNDYLSTLREVAFQQDCSIHAYVLMTNHVHLLVTGWGDSSVSAMMQSLGRRYVRRFNSRHGRTGTLWEGRFKSSLIDSEHYLLTCYRYIELNPVRANMVGLPQDFAWSSVHANAWGQHDPLVQPHAVYLGLAGDQKSRLQAYRSTLGEPMPKSAVTAIRKHTHQCKALGNADFLRQMATLTGKDVVFRNPGRPCAT